MGDSVERQAGAILSTETLRRLSCRSFAANAVRLQLHALAYNLGNFLRTLADWSLTSLKEKLIKIGAKIVSHGRYGKISRRAFGRRSGDNNAPKAPCAGDRGFETGQKTGAILENSHLNDSGEAARHRPLIRGREKTRIMVGSWRMKAHNWQPSGESRLIRGKPSQVRRRRKLQSL
jgi:Transposase DDE domain group 1